MDKLEMQARAFQARVPDLGIQDDNVPNLEKAYPLVVRDYFNSDAVLASHGNRRLNAEILTPCAQHFHNFWINPRRAWPTSESGEPDWELIYVLIVDHYL
ncbi:MAG: hypothetical protein L0Y67_02815, partial [Gammaproteobacteria bacterium]|nr:hypothetical protein [Gammaproteobacteria bacterium]